MDHFKMYDNIKETELAVNKIDAAEEIFSLLRERGFDYEDAMDVILLSLKLGQDVENMIPGNKNPNYITDAICELFFKDKVKH